MERRGVSPGTPLRGTLATLVIAALFVHALPVYAQGTREQGVRVRGDRVGREREHVEDSPRFATSIDTRTRGPLVESVADLLDEAPGLHARRSGDGLSPTALSLRGAPASHVTLALDGVVLNDASSEGVDLSLLPPALLERVDVYRGAAPVRLGVAGLGGSVELITRAPSLRPAAWLAGSYGSFGQRRASAVLSARAGPLATLVAFAYRGTHGNFTFYDDHGTELDERDDTRDAPRVNNAADALDLLGRACVTLPRGSSCGLLLVGWRERGLPGPGSVSLATPSLAQSRLLARASQRFHIGGAGHLEGFLALVLRRDHFRDYRAEALPGMPVDAQSNGALVETGLVGELRIRWLRLAPALRMGFERFERSGTAHAPLAMRYRALLGADGLVTLGSVEIAPAFALEAMSDVSESAASLARMLFSPRLGARIRLGPLLELRVNAAHLERAPTLPELFGVGGALLGNESLRPEASETIDLGLVARARTGAWNVRIEGAGFARGARDLIVLLRRGVVSLKPFNLRGSEIYGLEASLRVAHGRDLALVVSYAFTSALTRSNSPESEGRQVPSIPAHDLYARIEGALGPLGASVDLAYVSGIYFDEANTRAAPPRILLGASLSFTPPFARWLSASLLASNLLDQRDATVTVYQRGGGSVDIRQPIADFAGYPLPGRALMGAITITTEPHR